MIEMLFTQALGLVAPWQVGDEVLFKPESGRIDFQVRSGAAVHTYPARGGAAAQPLHGRLARSWRHLVFFQYESHLHAEMPRVACACCGKVTQIPVPWAREGRRFTLLFEALTLMPALAPNMSVMAAGRLLRVRSGRLWRVIEHHVGRARAQESHAGVSEPELSGTRLGLHKKPADWTVKKTETMHGLQRSNLKTARAWRIKQALRAIYIATSASDEARPPLKRWLSWASRCRLEPFKRLGGTITKHLPGVLNGFQAGKHDGRVEAINRALHETRARARGYHRVGNFIATAYLIAEKLTHLPASPFAPCLPVPHETT